MARTDKKTIGPGQANNLGWRDLIENDGETHVND